MFCCQIQEGTAQKIEYQDTPLKLKIIQGLGLKDFVINNFVFARPETSYSSRLVDNEQQLVIKDSPYIAPLGYTYQYFVLNCQNHSIPVVYLKYTQQRAKSTVIYSHGNASNLAQSLGFLSSIADHHKADYIAYDYTGYGESEFKETTAASICEDLEILLAWINKPLEEIVLIGFSLGCFPTAKTAAKHKIKAIVLLSPMASLISIFQEKLTPFTFFKDDQFNLLEIVENIESHIMLAHSRDDQLIPFRHSEIIYERYTQISKNPSIELVELKRINHNEIHHCLTTIHQNSFKRKFFSFLRKVEEKFTVQHYIYSRKKLESEREGKLNRQIRQLLKKDSINRQKDHIAFSKTHFTRLRSQTKLTQ